MREYETSSRPVRNSMRPSLLVSRKYTACDPGTSNRRILVENYPYRYPRIFIHRTPHSARRHRLTPHPVGYTVHTCTTKAATKTSESIQFFPEDDRIQTAASVEYPRYCIKNQSYVMGMNGQFLNPVTPLVPRTGLIPPGQAKCTGSRLLYSEQLESNVLLHRSKMLHKSMGHRSQISFVGIEDEGGEELDHLQQTICRHICDV